eukprot:m51a1_g7237 putative serine-threonine protein (756) ;mRNA; f:95200-98125
MPLPCPLALGALALVCLALRVSASPEDQCTGAGSLVYDSGSHFTLTAWGISNPIQPLCRRTVYYANVAQLFEPVRVPWRLTRVCFAMFMPPAANRSVPLAAAVHGTVSLYPTLPLFTLSPADRTAFATFSTVVRYDPAVQPLDRENTTIVPTWVSVDVSALDSPMIAWEKGVFVGVNYWSCGPVLILGTKMPENRKHLTMAYNAQVGIWSPYSQDAFTIRAVGSDYNAVPPGWFCDKAKYHDGNCDCNCGVADVDCNTNFTSDCGPGYVCDQSSRCVALDWGKERLCNASNYWQYDGCQCECGDVIDPDCLDPTASVNVCHGKFIKPFCETGLTTWKCNPSAYNDGKICDCECGVMDPDCLDHSLNTTCPGNNICIAGKCSYPRSWTCESSWYNESKGCDCNCGAYDPDCDNDAAEVFGCNNPGAVCNYKGRCVLPGCGNDRVDRKTDPKEECDGGEGCVNCKCIAGYYPTKPIRQGCRSRCGDNYTTGSEQCDGGAFCTNCTCDPGHSSLAPQLYCSGCGNGELEPENNESCDGGLGCDDRCRCKAGYAPGSPLTRDCESLEKTESKSNRNKVIIASTVGSVGGFLLLVGVIAALLYARKVKYGPRKLNLPVEMNFNTPAFSSVDSGLVPVDPAVGTAPSPQDTLVPVVGPDGAVYLASPGHTGSGGSDSSGSHQLAALAVGLAVPVPQLLVPSGVSAPAGIESHGSLPLEPHSDLVPAATSSPALAEASQVEICSSDTSDMAQVVQAIQQTPK